MDIESLLRLLVPLGFLAIWAISWLFNREGTSLPPRANPGGTGNRTPQSFGLEPSGTTRTVSSEPLRWSNQTLSPSDRQGQSRNASRGTDDDILIIGEGTRPARGGSGGQFGARSRRGRGRAEAKEKQPPAKVPTTNLGLISQQIAQEIARPLDLTPLNTPSAPISNDLTHASLVVGPTASVDLTQATRNTIQAVARDPKRMREAFLLAEILKPAPSAAVFRHRRASNPPMPEIDPPA